MEMFRTMTAATFVGAATLALSAFAPQAFSANNDAVQDVLSALAQANAANQDLASAFLATKPSSAMPRAQEGTTDVFGAYKLLLEAAQDANSSFLLSDANAMLAVYTKMSSDVSGGNLTAALQDSQNAQTIANKAVVDVSH